MQFNETDHIADIMDIDADAREEYNEFLAAQERQQAEDAVRVIDVFSLLHEAFGDNWLSVPYSRQECFLANFAETSNAHYHAWSGPSYMHLAERYNAVQGAIEAGKSCVVIEAMS